MDVKNLSLNLDFKQLNPKDIGSWPWIIKGFILILLFLGIIGAAYWFIFSEQITALETAEAKEKTLKDEFINKKKQAINLDIYRKQLKEIEQSFGALLKQLPNKTEMEGLITDINQAGLGRGLEFESFKPASSENFSEFYATLPISIRVTGSYHDLAAFASDIAQLPRIVTLNNISILPVKTGLVMNATAMTYRYLDDTEIAARKKASAPAPAAAAAAPAKKGK
jgi:type IV pilus assembly protein PilO